MAKFRFTGEVPVRDVTLELERIVPSKTVIKKGDVIETDRPEIIERLKFGAQYEEVKTKAAATPKAKDIKGGE